MAFCASCGRELAEDARFCEGCGAAQGAQAPQQLAAPPQQPMPHRQPGQYQPQHQHAAPAAPKRGNGPLFAIIAVVLVAAIGASAWWWFAKRPMSEAEYKKAAEEVLSDFGEALAGLEAMDTEDFDAGQRAVKESADEMEDLVGRAKRLAPPETFEDAHEDLVDALEGFADFMARIDEIAQKASDEDEASAMMEEEFSDAEGLAFFSTFSKLASALQALELDPVEVLGEEFADLAVGSGDFEDTGSFEDARSSAQERSCFANQRTLEGAAQVYLADDTDHSLADLDGSNWEYELVPDYVMEVPYCPTYSESYPMYDGAVECPTHGHY